MKTLAFVCAVLWYAGALAFQNEPAGFRGIPWGAPVSAVPEGVSHEEGDGDLRFYRRVDDKLQIGEAQLRALVYSFYRDRFSGVTMTTAGYANKRALLLAFQAQFGEPNQPNRFIESYFWSGRIARAAIICRASDSCTALIDSTAIADEQRAARKAAAEKGRADF